jgi:hypothetical protein
MRATGEVKDGPNIATGGQEEGSYRTENIGRLWIRPSSWLHPGAVGTVVVHKTSMVFIQLRYLGVVGSIPALRSIFALFERFYAVIQGPE